MCSLKLVHPIRISVKILQAKKKLIEKLFQMAFSLERTFNKENAQAGPFSKFVKINWKFH